MSALYAIRVLSTISAEPEEEELAEALGSVRLLGGCCGTDHEHVAAIIAAWSEA